MPNSAPTIANLNGDSATFVVGGGAVRLDADTNTIITDPDPFGFEVIRAGSGFSGGPLFIVEVPDGSGRMYVVEKSGTIRILDPSTGAIAATPFLSVTGQVSTSGEQGLLGFALAPNFATSGVFYIYMTNLSGDNEVRRYSILPGNMNQADAASADRILLLPHPGATNHNAGWIAFGPDNMLYIPTGDGAVGANAQSVNRLLGKILRIDPSSDAFPADLDRDYAIPAGNPFAGPTPGLDEIWALGLRNPFRASFDSLTGNLWIGDVGEGAIEEIDLAPAGQAGLNFGWNVQEGTNGPNNPAFTRPVAEYGHGSGPFQGNSITGGLVYRGPIAGLDGHYLFGDFFDEIWSVPVNSLVQGSTLPSSGFTLRNTAFTPSAGTINQITSFATDSAGNLYITDLGGEVFRVQVSAAPNFAGGSLTVEIGTGEVPAEDRLGFAAGSVALSNGTNFGSQVRVDGILVGTIAPGGTGVNGEPLVVLFSSGATQGRISTLVQAVTYSNAAANPTLAARSVTIRLNDGAGITGGGQDTVVVSTVVNVSTQSGVILNGTPGDDQLVGGDGDDRLDGLAGQDTLDGGAGHDVLLGGSGADDMTGGSGNDTIFVDDLSDLVFEAVNGGQDNVATAVSYALTAGAEVEVLSTTGHGGTANVFLVGNAFGQTIIGNAGNNYLDGGGGADNLQGLGGNDTIIVDGNDTVIEAAGGGLDTVAAKENFTLTPGAEVETLITTNDSGTSAIALVGNAFSQAIAGNAGNNYLDGGGGADTLYGRGGNDTFIVDTNDFIVETVGGGTDTVAASGHYQLNGGAEVEILSTTNNAGTGAIDLTGNEVGQSMAGNAGANRLDGRGGHDLLIGFGGTDSFAFTTALGSGNIDTIADMVSGVDRILLDDAVFTGLAPGMLVDAAFRVGSSAQDADDRIIYNPVTGVLLFDADGSGASGALHFATLSGAPGLTSADFFVI